MQAHVLLLESVVREFGVADLLVDLLHVGARVLEDLLLFLEVKVDLFELLSKVACLSIAVTNFAHEVVGGQVTRGLTGNAVLFLLHSKDFSFVALKHLLHLKHHLLLGVVRGSSSPKCRAGMECRH